MIDFIQSGDPVKLPLLLVVLRARKLTVWIPVTICRPKMIGVLTQPAK